MPTRLKKTLRTVLAVVLGVGLGILLLEPVFRSNTTFLPRGVAAPLPVDRPLMDWAYDIRYADADIFYWQASIVRPPVENLVESRVRWRTDEWGFPNPAPVPADVDLVILGRSYAMGAQAEEPWPDLLRNRYGLRVLNLSQTGNNLREKKDFLQRFGLPRHPQSVLIEILPPIDVLGYGPAEPWLIRRVLFPFAQSAIRSHFLLPASPDSRGYIYPLRLDLSTGTSDLVFYSGYLSALTLTREDWVRGSGWGSFRADLIDWISDLRQNGIVPILLFVPTKETVYIPLMKSPQQLDGALVAAGIAPSSDAYAIQANASAAGTLLREFADEQMLCLVDPSLTFTASVETGSDPFMRYDTHWSAAGHALVAREVAGAIQAGGCR